MVVVVVMVVGDIVVNDDLSWRWKITTRGTVRFCEGVSDEGGWW